MRVRSERRKRSIWCTKYTSAAHFVGRDSNFAAPKYLHPGKLTGNIAGWKMDPLKLYFPWKMGIFQPAMLVYQDGIFSFLLFCSCLFLEWCRKPFLQRPLSCRLIDQKMRFDRGAETFWDFKCFFNMQFWMNQFMITGHISFKHG